MSCGKQSKMKYPKGNATPKRSIRTNQDKGVLLFQREKC